MIAQHILCMCACPAKRWIQSNTTNASSLAVTLNPISITGQDFLCHSQNLNRGPLDWIQHAYQCRIRMSSKWWSKSCRISQQVNIIKGLSAVTKSLFSWRFAAWLISNFWDKLWQGSLPFSDCDTKYYLKNTINNIQHIISSSACYF